MSAYRATLLVVRRPAWAYVQKVFVRYAVHVGSFRRLSLMPTAHCLHAIASGFNAGVMFKTEAIETPGAVRVTLLY